MARTRYRIHDRTAPHFLTATVADWLPLFGRPEHAQAVLESLCYLAQQEAWTIYVYGLMENHLHWIVDAPDLVDALGGSSRSRPAGSLTIFSSVAPNGR